MFLHSLWIFISIIEIRSIQSNDSPTFLELPQNLSTYALNDFLDPILNDLGFPEEIVCKRTCEVGSNAICYLKMHVESYQVMGAACGLCANGVHADCQNPQCITADGFEKNAVSINRKIPGPLIQVCQNDLIVVDVYNKMHSDSLSIHWHGMHQRDTQYMDGVPFVTQCPINPNNRFRYTFRASESGTHFYHSHSGIQRYNGAFGGLIIRKPLSNNAASVYYDMDEHVIILTDWSHNAPELFYVGLPTRSPGTLPEAVLINGKGKFLDPTTQTFTPTPYEKFYVTGALRYRFRIINAGSTACPMEMQIQDHKMSLISADGNDVQPVTFDTLTIASGERYDVIVETNQNPGTYWILVKLIGTCARLNIFQNAILTYDPNFQNNTLVPIVDQNNIGYARGVTLNDFYAPCEPPQNWCMKNLKSLESSFDWFQPVDQKIYLKFSMKAMNPTGFFQESYLTFLNSRDNRLALGTMNNVSFHPPPHPLLTQNDENDITKFCHTNTPLPAHCENMQICACPYIIDVQQNSFVELILIDETSAVSFQAHPIHLHGYRFAVMTQGRILTEGPLTVDDIQNYESMGLLNNDNNLPPLKDIITVPSHGYAVLRFLADNPGFWLIHCHVENHMVFGMSAVIRVDGYVPPAPFNFPRCGDF